jgi:hypothetical protein
MADFVIYTVIGLSALAGLTLIALAGIVIYCLSKDLYRTLRHKPEVLPPPDKAASRTYDQAYFDKAVSKE